MTLSLTPLHPHEPVEFDQAILERICLEHGINAEAVIARLLSHIEKGLRRAGHHVQAEDRDGLRESCEDLIRLGAQLGMRTLELAAEAVLDCLDTGQDAALAACTGRLIRLGNPDTIDHWTVKTSTVA